MQRRSYFVLSCVLLAATVLTAAPKTLRVLTHSSFAATPSVIAAFEEANNVKVQFSAGGDAGETLSKAILSKGSPLADVLYGVDNTFLGRALAADILQPYDSPALSSVPAEFQSDSSHRLLPVDYGFVSLNYDRAWFVSHSLEVPRTLEDLLRAPYRSLLVVENPATSSPGLAFLLATVARFGETGALTWRTYWSRLRQNDVLVVNGWDDGYFNQFSAQGKGKRPIVVSYSTSPAYEMYNAPEPRPTMPPTDNILPDRSAFRQIEYVGILKGAKEPDLARRFVDFMLSQTFQADIPLQMWVYPARKGVELPEIFRAWAPVPTVPASIEPSVIDANREVWIKAWTKIVLE